MENNSNLRDPLILFTILIDLRRKTMIISIDVVNAIVKIQQPFLI